jgi:FemAB-related protein (PEP-CTERM system-associated)
MLNSTVFIRPTTPHDQGAWDHYVCNHPGGTAYQLSGFIRAVETAYRFKSICFLAHDQAQAGGRIKGVLPLIHLHLPFSKGSLISLPYCDAGGVLADNVSIEFDLIHHAMAYADRSKIKKVEIRSVKPLACLDPDLTRHPAKVRMLRRLPGSPEQLLISLKAKVRNQVNKPLRDGLRFRLGGRKRLREFYPIYCENMRDLGSPPHPFDWFDQILAAYGSRAHVGVVYTPDSTPAAGGIILCHPAVVSIPWASSLRRFNRLNPNMLLYRGFLSFAAANRFPFFDFGRSTPEQGTFRFKKQWGAIPYDLHWANFDSKINRKEEQHLTIGSGSLLHSGSKNRLPVITVKRHLPASIIMNMPIPVCRALGSITRKFISL